MFRMTHLQGFDINVPSRTQNFVDEDIFYPPTFIGLFWQDSASSSLTDNSSKWNGNTLRQVIDKSLFLIGGTVVRLMLQASSVAGFNIDAIYIGEQASTGDPYDMKASSPAPAQIKVGGSGSFSVVGNTTVATDPLVFTLDEAKTYVISAHFSGSSGDIGSASVVGATTYSKSGVNEAAIADVAGYTGLTDTLSLVTKVQVSGIGNISMISRSTFIDADNVYAANAGLPVIAPPATWSPTDKIATTLSNGNLTGTALNINGSIVRATQAKTTGKLYFEINWPSGTSRGGCTVGIALLSTALDAVAANATGGIMLAAGGTVLNNGSGVGTGYPTWNNSTAATICVAADLDNNSVWFRVNGGLWNNSGTANPTTNTGGHSVSNNFAPSSAAAAPITGFQGAVGIVATANFGGSVFAQALPGGFIAWNAG